MKSGGIVGETHEIDYRDTKASFQIHIHASGFLVQFFLSDLVMQDDWRYMPRETLV